MTPEQIARIEDLANNPWATDYRADLLELVREWRERGEDTTRLNWLQSNWKRIFGCWTIGFYWKADPRTELRNALDAARRDKT